MARVTLPEFPDADRFDDVPSWQKEVSRWADDLTSKLEGALRDLTTPVAPFSVGTHVTSNVAAARNILVGTSTATDVASANVLATLVDDLIKAGILSPNLTR